MDEKDEIKTRLPIDQLVAQYCQLKKKGRNFVALCPFHNDSHPSLLVSPDKGIAYCFACQSGGDIFSFVQKIEGVDFPEALKILAEKAGVKLTDRRPKTDVAVTKDIKVRFRECMEAAQAFYASKLNSTDTALKYVENRGVGPELISQFGIGYAPDSFSETYEYLLKKGFSRAEIVGAGLGIQRELKEERIYDRFRHRIMFPISDPQGGLIGFGGRTMGDADAKYVNSPESALYDKSSVLFGLFQGRDAVRSSRRAILVEGYFDAIAAHKAGVHNVVAVSGTALTEQHVKIIKRYADEVLLCLDQDNAGQLAAGRAFDLLSRAQLKIFSVTLPAKDPDELVQRDSALFSHLISQTAVPYIDAVIGRLKDMKDILEPAGKRKISEILFPLLSAVQSSVELRAYLEKAAQNFGIVESEIAADFRKFKSAEGRPLKKQPDLPAGPYSRQELTLGLALTYPQTRPLLKELIPLAEPLEKIRLHLIEASPEQEGGELIPKIDIGESDRERLTVTALYCEENFPMWSESLAIREMRKMISATNRELMVRKQHEIISLLKEARSGGRSDDEARLLLQYQQLLKLSRMAGNA
ncbi:DNA primase [Candidatus Peribacteria bacterium RIFCSPLOWO2_01_FULL_51_18]|nr:MAG: DNA primase [Candidatus Peribacteria bacterium RIFCSPHIGHO2_02_FULL_51_15]OGJ66452.1 MAG: DNA primase [Candidatus Peribacteria bacterium RIFCSPLOWO2_01_FULL_51_18]OGJ68201.1 MAG: DNA primase [Candidatus Peribacteria bacterium RIFCSPLOWO2_02_FULL_51_10]